MPKKTYYDPKLENELTETFKNWKPTLKERTISQYRDKLRKLRQDQEKDNFEFLKDADFMIHFLQNKYKNESTIKGYFNVIISYLSAIDFNNQEIDKYRMPRDILNDNYFKSQLSGEIVESQKKKFVSLDIIKDMVSQMKSELIEHPRGKEKELWRIWIVFHILTELPLRNDLASLIISSKNDMVKREKKDPDFKKKNYLIVGRSLIPEMIILNDYKTNLIYDRKEIPIKEVLKKPIRHFLTNMKLKVGDDFINWTRMEMTGKLAKYSNKYIGINVGTQILRHIYLTHKYGEIKKEMEKDANISGHSTNTQNIIYIKDPNEMITELPNGVSVEK
mgnify:CR=1 FL=1